MLQLGPISTQIGGNENPIHKFLMAKSQGFESNEQQNVSAHK